MLARLGYEALKGNQQKLEIGMQFNSAVAREKMVDCQIRTADVTQHNLVDAFLEVPREKFIPAERRMLTSRARVV